MKRFLVSVVDPVMANKSPERNIAFAQVVQAESAEAAARALATPGQSGLSITSLKASLRLTELPDFLPSTLVDIEYKCAVQVVARVE